MSATSRIPAVATRPAPIGAAPVDTALPPSSAAGPADDRPWPAAIRDVWEEAGRGGLSRAVTATVRGACAAVAVDDARSARLWSVAAARMLVATGRLRAARAAARCSLHMMPAADDLDLVEFAALDVLARVALSTGDAADLTEAAVSVTRMCASPVAEVTAAGDWLDLLLRDARSHEFGALAGTSHAPERPRTWFGAAPDVWEDARHARVLVRAGHRAAADALLQATADRVTEQPHRTDAAATHHAVAGVVGRDRPSSLRAASLFARSGQPLAAAAALEDAAAAPGPGGRDRAVTLLLAATRVYDRAGARADAARARATLVRLVGREHPPSRRAHPSWGPRSLAPVADRSPER